MIFWLTGIAAASTALLVGCIATNAEVAQQAAPAVAWHLLLSLAESFMYYFVTICYILYIQCICIETVYCILVTYRLSFLFYFVSSTLGNRRFGPSMVSLYSCPSIETRVY